MDGVMEFLCRALFGLAFAVLIGFWLKPGPATLGKREMFYGLGARSFGIFFLGFSAVATYGGFQTYGSNQLWAFGLAICFGAYGIYWVAETTTRRISYDETSLKSKGFHGFRSCEW